MCGVVGVYNVPDAAPVIRDLLDSLQHRGQESAGMAVLDTEGQLRECKGMGLVSYVFPNGFGQSLPGMIGIGHVRYSTTGASSARNIQPIISDYQGYGDVAIAHNGNFPSFSELRERLGGFYQTTTDTEILFHLIHSSPEPDLEGRLLDAAHQVRGAYASVVLADGKLYAMRDPKGFRPLSIGKLGQGWIVASETHHFDELGVSFQRDVEPGEMVIFQEPDEMRSMEIPHRGSQSLHACIFELVYFGHPANPIFGVQVDEYRMECGRLLAKKDKQAGMPGADLVSPVPDSGSYASIGYAEEMGLPFRPVFIRSHYGRSFTQPNQREREAMVKAKHIPVKGQINGKRIILVDDSIVRGTTMKRLVETLYQRGATEVHVRSASPMLIGSCRYGIDLKSETELIANACGQDPEEIRTFIGCTSLRYLSVEEMVKATGMENPSARFCSACFTGKYPAL